METIRDLLFEAEIKELENKLLDAMGKTIKALNEDVRDLGTPAGDIAAAFDEASKRLEAAKRGLAIVNSNRFKALSKEDQTMHRRRIFGNMNRLKALVNNLIMQAERDHQDQKPTPQFNPQAQGWMGARQGPPQGQGQPQRPPQANSQPRPGLGQP